MTPHSFYFSSYTAIFGNKHINVVNVSNTSIIGCGSIHLHPFFPLKNVIHVPKLSNNLLSIQKVVQGLNCAMVFFHSHCVFVFQDLAMGRTIGIVKENGGLYYLQPEENKKCARLQANTSNLSSRP